MHTLRTGLVLSLALVTAFAAPGLAQDRHVVDPKAISDAVDQHVASQEANRAAIREALERPEVREIASRMGVDVEGVAASVGTLSGAELERAGAAARDVNQSLVGGASTVVLSTTTIIIILLVVILLIVAIR